MSREMRFWEIVEPLQQQEFSAVNVKSIIYDEAVRHKTVQAVAVLFLKNGVVAQNIQAYAHRRVGGEFGLESDEVDHVIGLRMQDVLSAEQERTSTSEGDEL